MLTNCSPALDQSRTIVTVRSYDGTSRLGHECPASVYDMIQSQISRTKALKGDSWLKSLMCSYRCSLAKSTNTNCYWTVENPQRFACKTCTNSHRPCFNVDKNGHVAVRMVSPLLWDEEPEDWSDPEEAPLSCFIAEDGVNTNGMKDIWSTTPARKSNSR